MSGMGTEFSNWSQKEIEEGRLLFAKPCYFILGATREEHMPCTNLPEIAFAGRSNVGKSTLLNTLTGYKRLARTSNTPGRTQEINFFNLDNTMVIADLPGYGYAKASKSRVKSWTTLVKKYLKGRVQLRRACLLIDSRHGIKRSDQEIMSILDTAAVNYQIVLTKTDKISRGEEKHLLSHITSKQTTHTALHPVTITTSSKKGIGINNLRAELRLLL